jgi:CHAT domain-containing protein
VLSTLWSISDAGTQHFMSDFYQRFLNGTKPQQAFRETQLAMLKGNQWNHPFYLAPFVMTGK